MSSTKDYIEYELLGGKRPVSWILPVKAMMLVKKDENGHSLGKKKIHYIPGASSIFVEDYKGDERPRQIVFLDGLLRVDKEEKNLIEILNRHRLRGVKYDIRDEEKEQKDQVEYLDLYDEARALIKIASEDELKATAIATFGIQAYGWTTITCKAKLGKKAQDEPKALIEEFNSGDFKAKLLAALSLVSGVLVINTTNTAISWEDGGQLLAIPLGKDPIAMLSLYFSGEGEQVQTTMQTIEAKIKRKYNKKVDPVVPTVSKETVTSQEVTTTTEDTTNKVASTETTTTDTTDSTEVDATGESDLEAARAKYSEVLGKEVPNNMKNNLEWILEKINEESK